jgi:hypothetical protein
MGEQDVNMYAPGYDGEADKEDDFEDKEDFEL